MIGVITVMQASRTTCRQLSVVCSSVRAAIALTDGPASIGAAKEKTTKARVAKMERVKERIVNECGGLKRVWVRLRRERKRENHLGRMKNLIPARPGIYTRGGRRPGPLSARPMRRYRRDTRCTKRGKCAAQKRLGPEKDMVKHGKR